MLCVSSEYGALKKAVVHRPGKELDRLTIDNKDDYLFDDILWLEEARGEFDAFVHVLEKEGVEVFFFENLLRDILRSDTLRGEILEETLALEALDRRLASYLQGYCFELSSEELARVLLAGITKEEIFSGARHLRSVCLKMMGDQDFVIRPLPNSYFQRDPYTVVNSLVLVSAMHYEIRKREALYCKYVVGHHELFREARILWGGEPGDTCSYTVEGGDILVLNSSVVAMGIGERTTPATIQILGGRLAEYGGIRRVMAVEIPKTRSTTHLDTVFSMVDRDTFVMYPGIGESTRVLELRYDEGGNLLHIEEKRGLKEALREALNLDSLKVVETGGGDVIKASREQWNDATNCLALAPGKVISYNRNTSSNEALREKGLRVIEISGKELGRGRGGPRCMANPLFRG
ncbi:MAG TPA: arginine deiminase [Synergistaceae bacterium]|nr:arginine deiminase [Synergistaceae bacterium]HPQ36591.1 arginine deiminase [Synergistaceae bacterium]